MRLAADVTYLCIQCPGVSKTRERHRKDHPFCECTQHWIITSDNQV
jgi:hypothetical protein